MQFASALQGGVKDKPLDRLVQSTNNLAFLTSKMSSMSHKPKVDGENQLNNQLGKSVQKARVESDNDLDIDEEDDENDDDNEETEQREKMPHFENKQ